MFSLSLSLSLARTHTHTHILSLLPYPSLSLPLSTSLPPSLATATGSAGKHWKREKIFTVGLLGLIPVGLVYPNAVVDYGLAVAIPLHGHWSVNILMQGFVNFRGGWGAQRFPSPDFPSQNVLVCT